MNQMFCDYVTNASFNLKLTKGQIFALSCIIENKRDHLILDSSFMTYLQALERKGLLSCDCDISDDKAKKRWGVTVAGNLAYQLCREAGIINT